MYWKYFKYLIKHKWFVTVECFKHGLFWRGLMHDVSKFRPSEFFPYATFFYGRKGGDGIKTGRDKSGYYSAGVTVDDAFNFAWLLHQKRNDHHWQWWWLKLDDGEQRCFVMSIDAMMEMICDWVGAGRAITGKKSPKDDPYKETREWYMKNYDKIMLHQSIREEVNCILRVPVSFFVTRVQIEEKVRGLCDKAKQNQQIAICSRNKIRKHRRSDGRKLCNSIRRIP